jgi:hypothetical protein
MTVTQYFVTHQGEDPLPALFQVGADGYLHFGFAAKSKDEISLSELLESEREFIGYVMEGFVRFFIHAKPTQSGLQLSITATGGNRDAHLSWLVEHQFKANGCIASRVAA